jgi:hypothetical protein
MTFRFRTYVLAGLSLLAVSAACRQADGPLPVAEGESINRIEDLSKDLRNVSSGQQDALLELSEDLAILNDRAPRASIDALGRRLQTSLAGLQLQDAAAQDLARTLFVGLSAREWNDRQVEQFTTGLATQLAEVGASQPEGVVGAVDGMMRETATRPPRWYEFF